MFRPTRTARRLAFAVAIAASAALAQAEVKLAGAFGDHMVLQREKPVVVWGTAAAGKSVTVKYGSKTATATAGDDGKFLAKLPEMRASDEPAELTVAEDGGNTVTIKDVVVGDVWICSGQSNMEWTLSRAANAKEAIPAATDPGLRLLRVPRATAYTPQAEMAPTKAEHEAKWERCSPEAAPSFSAVGYFFGKKLRETEKVPVGLIHTAWGGTGSESWTPLTDVAAEDFADFRDRAAKMIKSYPEELANYEKKLAAHNEAKAKDPATKPFTAQRPLGEKSPHQPSVLYNGMIAPLVPMTIRGAIWYQGENNAGRAANYRVVFPAMITGWRREFAQGDFPFLLVQLAGWNSRMDKPEGSPWAELREAQFLATQKLKNVGMATAVDVGNPGDIHPKDKQTVGDRLALAAQKVAYGKPVVHSGPVFRSVKLDGNKAVLTFDQVGGGLTAKDDGALRGFTVAGEDKVFHRANAVIDGDAVVVTAPAGIDKVTAVRYAWADYPETTLYNRDGLPAVPFRTDDWPLVTDGKR